jgi:hypothetical protein
VPPGSEEIIRHTGQQLESRFQISHRLMQHDFIATPENLNFINVEAEFLRQADGLRITIINYFVRVSPQPMGFLPDTSLYLPPVHWLSDQAD